MHDVFLSYSSKDRERVAPLRDAIANSGFSVFWDQDVPPGTDWDTWIRNHLSSSRCAVVAWTTQSIESKNVRHEAVVALKQDKLISVLLDPVPADRFPMGLYTTEAVDLAAWSGDPADAAFVSLREWLETKLTPSWMAADLEARDAALSAERTRREAAETQVRVLRDQIARDTIQRSEMQQERDQALAQLSELKSSAALNDRGRFRQWMRIVVVLLLCGLSAVGGYFLRSEDKSTKSQAQQTSSSIVPETKAEDLSPEDCRIAAADRLSRLETALTTPVDSTDALFRQKPDISSLIARGWGPTSSEKFFWLRNLEELCVRRDNDLGKWVQCNWSRAQLTVLPGLSAADLEKRRTIAETALESLRQHRNGL